MTRKLISFDWAIKRLLKDDVKIEFSDNFIKCNNCKVLEFYFVNNFLY